jgi:branched-chain amino acid transport system ATP-binding protein
LRRDHAILLIEHDMDAVFQLADRISVLVYGEVLTTDTPQNVRRSQAVRDAYLGDEAD